MDIKACIKMCTKLDKAQAMSNIKWFTVPKDESPKYPKKSLPSHLAMAKSLHAPSDRKHGKNKKHNNKSENKHEQFQVAEIRTRIREAGYGWNVSDGIEKRYKESRKNATLAVDKGNSGSDGSFTTAFTTVTNLSEDSYCSATQDLGDLKISNESVESDILESSTEINKLFKRNALMKGIAQTKRNKRRKNKSQQSSDCTRVKNESDAKNKISNVLENSSENELKNENKKFQQCQSKADKSRKPLKDLNQNGSNKKDHMVPEKDNVVKTSRKYYMNIPYENFEYENVKTMKKPKKSIKPGQHGF